jgi:hypothetical protein
MIRNRTKEAKKRNKKNERSRPYETNITLYGKRKNLGSFKTPEEAHKAWQFTKRDYLLELINKYCNDALKIMYYQHGDEELNTLQQWNKKGFSVKKGEKALLLWGEPRHKKYKKDNKAEEGEENEDDLQFFPICYVFSKRQVTESKKGGAR